MLNETGKGYKTLLDNLSRDEFLKVRYYEVSRRDRKPTDVSRGAASLRLLLNEMSDIPKEVETVLEIGAGRGGWIQAMKERFSWKNYRAYSRWPLNIDPIKYNISCSPYQNLDEIPTSYADILLSDYGRSSHGYMGEVDETIELLERLTSFILLKPKHVIVKIHFVFNSKVINILLNWKRILGSGTLVHLPCQRNSIATMYFINRGDQDLSDAALKLAEKLLDRIQRGRQT